MIRLYAMVCGLTFLKAQLQMPPTGDHPEPQEQAGHRGS